MEIHQKPDIRQDSVKTGSHQPIVDFQHLQTDYLFYKISPIHNVNLTRVYGRDKHIFLAEITSIIDIN